MTSAFHHLALVLLAGCSVVRMDDASHSTAASNHVTTPIYYEMDADQRRQFLEAVQALKAGATYQEVRNVLGSPFSEKAIRGKNFDDPQRGTSTTYYFRKMKRDVTNEVEDEYVSL